MIDTYLGNAITPQMRPAHPPPAVLAFPLVKEARDGKVTAFIPETKELSALEGVAADDAGNIYGGYTNTLNFTKGGPSEVNFRRWVKKAPGL